jgi:CRP-like cAMP-binding protein
LGRRSNEDTEFRVRDHYQRVLEPGETLFAEGEAGHQLYVIQAGEIELTREGPSGHRAVARLGPGDFLGELCIVAGRRHTARAVAVNSTRVLELDRETLEAMCLAQPEIAIRMIRVLTSRLIEAEHRLAALGVDDLLQPVVRTLIRQAVPEDGRIRIDTSLRRVAEDAGLSLLEAHRALHQLFDRKVLRLVDDRLVASDLEALSACLDP